MANIIPALIEIESIESIVDKVYITDLQERRFSFFIKKINGEFTKMYEQFTSEPLGKGDKLEIGYVVKKVNDDVFYNLVALKKSNV